MYLMELTREAEAVSLAPVAPSAPMAAREAGAGAVVLAQAPPGRVPEASASTRGIPLNGVLEVSSHLPRHLLGRCRPVLATLSTPGSTMVPSQAVLGQLEQRTYKRIAGLNSETS